MPRNGVLDPVPISTYQQCYRGVKNQLPPIKFHQLPAFVYRQMMQQPPRCFPIEPEGPSRRLCRNQDGPVLSKNVNVDKFTEPKPILKTADPNKIKIPKVPSTGSRPRSGSKRTPSGKERVFETRFGPMKISQVNELVNQVRWTSTTSRASKEACLPVQKVLPPDTTVEPKADQVRLRCVKYENKPEEWQNSVFWDAVQMRGQVNITDLNEKTHGQPEKLLYRRKKMDENLTVDTSTICKLVKEDGLSSCFDRPCPGYAGYVPRSPPNVNLERKPQSQMMLSTMKSAYKTLPVDIYKTQAHARKGPLSKTVSLTSPYNPYNNKKVKEGSTHQ